MSDIIVPLPLPPTPYPMLRAISRDWTLCDCHCGTNVSSEVYAFVTYDANPENAQSYAEGYAIADEVRLPEPELALAWSLPPEERTRRLVAELDALALDTLDEEAARAIALAVNPDVDEILEVDGAYWYDHEADDFRMTEKPALAYLTMISTYARDPEQLLRDDAQRARRQAREREAQEREWDAQPLEAHGYPGPLLGPSA
jgi:hypothetical protein